MNYHEFFNTLASNNSRNFKLELLESHKSDETLKEIINLALNPFINFYIRKIPQYFTDKEFSHYVSLEDALNSLSALYTRELTGNAAIYQRFAENLMIFSRQDECEHFNQSKT